MTDWKRQFEDAEEQKGIALMWLKESLELLGLTLQGIEKMYEKMLFFRPDFPDPTELIAETREHIAKAKAETGLDKVDA